MLRRAEEELAATREEAQFLRERLTAQKRSSRNLPRLKVKRSAGATCSKLRAARHCRRAKAAMRRGGRVEPQGISPAPTTTLDTYFRGMIVRNSAQPMAMS